MQRHLILRLEAPLMAFGDVAVDAIGPVRDLPSASMLTGLLGNALGFRREEGTRLARLQERLIFGCRLDRRGERFTDFQTVQLDAGDRAWSTHGRVETRAGGANTYRSPHIRSRDFDADASAIVALRLADAEQAPTLDDLARALDEPARPLFLGRKPCLPSERLLVGLVDAPTVYDALRSVDWRTASRGHRRRTGEAVLVWLPATEPCPEGFRVVTTSDRRDWEAGVHAGETAVYQGFVQQSTIEAASGERA